MFIPEKIRNQETEEEKRSERIKEIADLINQGYTLEQLKERLTAAIETSRKLV